MTRNEWIIKLAEAENDMEEAERDSGDHDGSEIDAPDRIAFAKARIAWLKTQEPS